MTGSVRAALRRELDTALKARDRTAISALRAALGALDNAEAADPAAAPPMESGVIAGGVAGLGAGEVARRELSDAEQRDLLRAEVTKWRAVAEQFERAGRPDDAQQQHAQADVVSRLLDDGSR